MTPWRIAAVAHGRFHMFDLARELIRMGHDVTLFTNYPRFACERFGIPPGRVVTHLLHGVATRVASKTLSGVLGGRLERWSNNAFGNWLARELPKHPPFDAVMCMSGVAEPLFRRLTGSQTLRVLHRGSVHILEQRRILDQELADGGGAVDRPSDWIVAREQREYELADLVQVLSTAARGSFEALGFPGEKLGILRLGVNVRVFTPRPEVALERARRVGAGEPLRVICVGTFSRRKGSRLWAEVLHSGTLSPARVRFVGPVDADSADIARSLAGKAEFVGKVNQAELPREYAWADLFALPTLEDGFAVVVTQALASGVPVITTTGCGAADLIESGRTGWVITPGRADELERAIRRVDANRGELLAAAAALAGGTFSRDWAATAEDAITNMLAAKRRREGG